MLCPGLQTKVMPWTIKQLVFLYTDISVMIRSAKYIREK